MMAERTFGQRCLKVGSADKPDLDVRVANDRFSNAAPAAKAPMADSRLSLHVQAIRERG